MNKFMTIVVNMLGLSCVWAVIDWLRSALCVCWVGEGRAGLCRRVCGWVDALVVRMIVSEVSTTPDCN